MSVLLFRLRGVPDDEADAIRQLLRDQRVNFYETEAGNWGISMPAIWLHDDDELERARRLLDDYQQQRAELARQQWQAEHDSGSQPRLLDRLRERPLLVIGSIAFCLVIAWFSIKPFIELATAP